MAEPTVFERKLETAGILVDRGATREARQLILELVRFKRIPARHVFALARLARLIKLDEVTVKLLGRRVRSKKSNTASTAGAEKAEYAAALNELGGSREALAMLLTLDETSSDVLLFRGFVYMSLWRFSEASSTLEQLLLHPRARKMSWAWLSSRLNLSIALIYSGGEYHRIKAILEQVIDRSQVPQYRYLYAQALLGLLRCEVWLNRSRLAAPLIERIKTEVLPDTDPRYLAEFMLWTSTSQTLSRAKLEFERLEFWEGLRLADLLEARRSPEPGILAKLYLGTPFQEFREQILALAGSRTSIPELYRWTPPRSAGFRDAPLSVMDPAQGMLSPRVARLKTGQALQRLFESLTEDFYQPKTLVGISEKLFPGMEYQAERSPDRVHQILRRFRVWARRNDVPLEVGEQNGFYRLRCTSPCEIVIRRERVESTVSNLR